MINKEELREKDISFLFQKLDERLNLRLTKMEKEIITDYAEIKKISMNDFVRLAIRFYLDVIREENIKK